MMEYDKNIFDAIREELAITNIDEIEVGQKYYSNMYPEEFVVIRKLTNGEADFPYDDQHEIGWLEVAHAGYSDDKSAIRTSRISTNDRNIGAHYNPWMIFKNSNCRDIANAALEIKFGNPDLDTLEVSGFWKYDKTEFSNFPS